MKKTNAANIVKKNKTAVNKYIEKDNTNNKMASKTKTKLKIGSNAGSRSK